MFRKAEGSGGPSTLGARPNTTGLVGCVGVLGPRERGRARRRAAPLVPSAVAGRYGRGGSGRPSGAGDGSDRRRHGYIARGLGSERGRGHETPRGDWREVSGLGPRPGPGTSGTAGLRGFEGEDSSVVVVGLNPRPRSLPAPGHARVSRASGPGWYRVRDGTEDDTYPRPHDGRVPWVVP